MAKHGKAALARTRPKTGGAVKRKHKSGHKKRKR